MESKEYYKSLAVYWEQTKTSASKQLEYAENQLKRCQEAIAKIALESEEER